MEISFVIPCYNAEKSIVKCIDSILMQSNIKPQIIVVNDGSTDSTADILSRMSSEYLEVYEIKNSGSGAARNYGIQYVNKPYLLFLDSDDYLLENCFNELTINNEDLILFSLNLVNTDGALISKEELPIVKNKSGDEVIAQLINSRCTFDAASMFIIKSEFFKHNYKFLEGYVHEDFGLMPRLLWSAKNVSTVANSIINYVQTTNSNSRSISSEANYKRLMGKLYNYDVLMHELDTANLHSKKLIYSTLANSLILEIKNLSGLDMDNYITELKKRNVTHYLASDNLKQKVKKALLKISLKRFSKYV